MPRKWRWTWLSVKPGFIKPLISHKGSVACLFCSTENVAQDLPLYTVRCFCSPPELCQTPTRAAPWIALPLRQGCCNHCSAALEPCWPCTLGSSLHHTLFCTGMPISVGEDWWGKRTMVCQVGIEPRDSNYQPPANNRLPWTAGGAKWLCLHCRACSRLELGKPVLPCKGLSPESLHRDIVEGRGVCPSHCPSPWSHKSSLQGLLPSYWQVEPGSLLSLGLVGQQWACPAEEAWARSVWDQRTAGCSGIGPSADWSASCFPSFWQKDHTPHPTLWFWWCRCCSV